MSAATATSSATSSFHHADADQLVAKYKDSIKGKTIVITGASPFSIGEQIVKSVSAASPDTIVLLGSTEERMRATVAAAKSFAGAAADSIKYQSVILDLSSQESVRKAAAEVNSLVPHIDYLFLNAGIMAAPWNKTAEGLESHFGINHVGHFLLANLVLDKVRAAGPGARVVVTSSDGRQLVPVPFEDLTYGDGANYHSLMAYAASKTANALFVVELARRLEGTGIQAFALHPGTVVTGEIKDGKSVGGIARTMTPADLAMIGVSIGEDGSVVFDTENREPPKTLPSGAATHIFAAFDPALASRSGEFLIDAAPASHLVLPHVKDPEAAKQLWTVSEQIVGQKF